MGLEIDDEEYILPNNEFDLTLVGDRNCGGL